jgi:8-oxo-dGTP pyrophosphatase MutT (NUDIX family)/phosphohistidine phosphatase SixA
MTVYAAGALLWRIDEGTFKVALVHRGRYDDWSWAKGKVDPGETLPQTAVREIREETGLKVVLGVPLGIQKYHLPNKNLKKVYYWAAKVTDKALAESKFVPNEEVSQVVWFTPEAAKAKLSYSHDFEQLELLMKYQQAGVLETEPLLVLRHGKARSRATWKDGEASRPLLAEGNDQAEALPKLLKAFGARLVFTSPWTRCLSTIAFYAQSSKVKVKVSPELTETANAKNGEQTKNVTRALINLNKAVIMCTHRPVMPNIIDEVEARTTDSKLKAKLQQIATLKPGSVAVIHLSKNDDPIERVVVDVEIQSPLDFKKK